jgi:small subunit ribosomal protein S3
MIGKKLVNERVVYNQMQEYIAEVVGRSKYSFAEIKKTPLGEKIVIHTTRPGLVVGRSGANIVALTSKLKRKFKLENPQIEVMEIENPNTNPRSVAERIVSHFDRFGTRGFKMIGYRELENTMEAGALGAEIVISGRGVPSSRSKTWRFQAGYLKKSGDVAESMVMKAKTAANLRSGTVGIQVSILPSDIVLPDSIKILKHAEPNGKEIKVVEENTEEKTEKKKTTKKKKVTKKTEKKEDKKEVKKEKKEKKTEKKDDKK